MLWFCCKVKQLDTLVSQLARILFKKIQNNQFSTCSVDLILSIGLTTPTLCCRYACHKTKSMLQINVIISYGQNVGPTQCNKI